MTRAARDPAERSSPFEIRQEILPWQGILPGVASGKYRRVALSAAVITDERVKVPRLHDADLRIDDGLREAQRAMHRSSTIKDLSGKTLGVQQGGASFQVLPPSKPS
jgi:polar amino acid transport system substrate-binding protein